MILGFVGVLLMNINTSIVFYWSLVSGHHIHSNFRWGVLAAGSLVSFLVGSLVSSLVGSLVSSSVSSSFAFSLGSSSLNYRYGFTAVVLKLVGLLKSCTLHISLLILSNLNGLIHLPLYLILPFCYISMSKLRGRSWIMVIDRLFY